MKTDDLINMLSSGPDVAVVTPPLHTILLPLLAALCVSAFLMLSLLGLLPNLGLAMALPAFWLKLAFSLILVGVAGHAVKRLVAPGASIRRLPLLLGAPILTLWIIAAAALWLAAPDLRGDLFWGRSWRSCPLVIAVLSVPMLAATMFVMRGFAPTRLRLAGAAAGFVAGASAAALYCLHCPEMSPLFVGFWYLLGILSPTALGAVLGRRVLAW